MKIRVFFLMFIFCNVLQGAQEHGAPLDDPQIHTKLVKQSPKKFETLESFLQFLQNRLISPAKTVTVRSVRFFRRHLTNALITGRIKIDDLKQKFNDWRVSRQQKKVEITPTVKAGPVNPSTSTPITAPNPKPIPTQRIKIPVISDLQPFSKNRINLQSFAEELGYGYKTANLMQLKELVSGIDWVDVPEFKAINSTSIQNWLKTKNIDIAAQWNTICANLNYEEIMTQRKYPELFLKNLSILEKSIKETFSEAAKGITEEEFERLFDSSLFSNISEWIKKIAQKNSKLMVRSTGREDTDEVSNAGGNESVKNVNSEISKIVEAIGIVVASYFSVKSFTQRLGVRDSKLFDLPLTPILIQEMIGETEGGPIPSSGVMFTEEAEGGWANIRESHSEIKGTTGLTLIQASFGHNEGVVNGLVPIDTYYIGPNNDIHAVIKNKHTRIVPAHNNPVANPIKIADTPAIDRQVIYKLKHIANELERFYTKPMDVEFVYDPNTKKISIVQARPITYKKKLLPPCFLKDVDTLKKTRPNNIITGTSIGYAGGSLRLITSRDQIIFANTLREALLAYFKVKTPGQISCIIVENMAPATSHEATTFRIEGKPIFCVENSKEIREWIKTRNLKLVVDFQQEVIIKWQGAELSLEELKTSQQVMVGWVNYPIPLQLSVGVETSPTYLTAEQHIKRLSAGFTKEELYEFANKPLGFLITAMKRDDQKTAKKAVLTILKSLVGQAQGLQNLTKRQKIANELVKQFETLVKIATGYALEVVRTLHFPPLDARRLYSIRFLEALIYQTPSEDVINGYSFKQMYQNIGPEYKIIKRGITDPVYVQLAKISSLAFNEETREKWKAFIKNFAEINEEAKVTPETSIKNTFSNLIIELNKHELIPLWLHTSFEQMYKPADPVATIKALNEEFTKSKDFLNELALHRKRIDEFNSMAFEEPKAFDFLKEGLEGLIAYFIADDQFIEHFKACELLGKLASLNLMGTLVDKFDLAIKSLEGSPKYEDVGLNVSRFKELLQVYFKLLQKWIILLPEAAGLGRNVSSAKDIEKSVNSALEKNICDNPSDQIKPSTLFDAASFAIGRVCLVLIPPITLEDIFTAIHQNLLNVISILMQKCDLLSIQFPEYVTAINTEISNKTDYYTHYPTGISIRQNFLKLSYNFPLKRHSLMVDATFNLGKATAKIFCKFVGMDASWTLGYGRWQLIESFARIVEYIFGTVITDLMQKPLSLEFTFNFSDQNDNLVKNLGNVLKIMCDQTRPHESRWEQAKFFKDQFDNHEKYKERVEFLIFRLDGTSKPYLYLVNALSESVDPKSKLLAMIFGTSDESKKRELQNIVKKNQKIIDEFFDKLKDGVINGALSASENLAILIETLNLLNQQNLLRKIVNESLSIIQQLLTSNDVKGLTKIMDLLVSLLKKNKGWAESINFVLINAKNKDFEYKNLSEQIVRQIIRILYDDKVKNKSYLITQNKTKIDQLLHNESVAAVEIWIKTGNRVYDGKNINIKDVVS